ncbi:isochorismatase family protein [Steroidobacter sp. S1-65]|uniref:Isochorismatase family protein n=1 Tax=Steroidobacter gossypii TaxID=2805490 RepID=A0ABS1X4X2_9GAMM|nr:isochorismatase family protein [Steroidobacter gossypii]MBM0108278.1 isochorismatase family protein [Steroidobacter gossypii]
MKSALIVIDVQQSFTRRAYWDEAELPMFLQSLQGLVNRAHQAAVPVLQVFHVDEEGPENAFSFESGLIKTLPQLDVRPTEVFTKAVHSAMFATTKNGRSLDYWLRAAGIQRLIVTGIRTEQCCETTTRHASDLGYSVTYAMDATLTFPMVSGSGRKFTAQEIRDRTELVLQDRFAQVQRSDAVVI